MVRVSVVIPTYNRKEMLEEAVQSVLNQSYEDFELIVVDDGSIDGTKDVIERLDSDIRYIYKENGGVSSARNFGVKKAKGEFIAFLDSDDMWLKDKLEKQVKYMSKRSDLFVSQTEEIWIRNGVRVNQKKKHKKCEGRIFKEVLPLCIISPSAVIMRRELFDHVGLFDEEFLVCEDYDLWIRVAAKYPVGLLKEKLIIKRGGHEDQLSKSEIAIDRFRVKAMKKAITGGSLTREQINVVLDNLEEKSRILINGYLKRKKFKEAEIIAQEVSKCISQPRFT